MLFAVNPAARNDVAGVSGDMILPEKDAKARYPRRHPPSDKINGTLEMLHFAVGENIALRRKDKQLVTESTSNLVQ